MRIGIIGAGNVGEALAGCLVALGYEVQIANSRGRDSLAALTRTTGAKAVDVADVSSAVDILFIAIPLARVAELPHSVVTSLPQGGIVVDAGNYYPRRDGAIGPIDQGLPESEWTSQQLGIPVVKAFNNIIASRLVAARRPKGDQRRIALPVAGDDDKARLTVETLVEALGFSAYGAGSLAESWRQQPGQPAYCTDPTLDELPLLLSRADPGKAVRNRDKASKILANLPLNFPAEKLVQISRLSAGLDRLQAASWLAVLHLGVALLQSRR